MKKSRVIFFFFYGPMVLFLFALVSCSSEEKETQCNCKSNHPPMISEVTSLTQVITSGGTIIVKVEASDPDGDKLTYRWYASAGTIEENNGDSITWVAPVVAYDQQVLIGVNVYDGKGAEDNGSTIITVRGYKHENHPPAVNSVTASKEVVDGNEVITITVDASDPDGDSLTYKWYASGGTITANNGNSITWVAPVVAYDQQVLIGVNVYDEEDAGDSGSTIISVKGYKHENHPPVIDSVIATYSDFTTGMSLPVTVVAHDPDGDRLSYHWLATGGWYDDPETSATMWHSPVTSNAKKYILAIVVSDSRGAVSMKSVSVSDLSFGLVAYYSFDNCSAHDDSGNEYDGTIRHGSPLCVTTAVKGKAMRFEESNEDVIGISSDKMGDFTSISVCGYLKTTDSTSTFFSGANSFYENEFLVILQKSSGSTGGQIRVCIHNHTGSCWDTMVYINDGKYHHVCVVSDKFSTKLYVDGVRRAETSEYKVGGTPLYFEKIWLGMDQDGVDSWGYPNSENLKQFFDGFMDEVRIYRRALSDNEVLTLYNKDNADLNKSLLAYYSFDSCDAHDDSGNGYDGTIKYGNPQCVTSGVKGKAFKFNEGSRDIIGISKDIVGLTSISVCGYLKTTDSTATFFSGANSAYDNDFLIIIQYANSVSQVTVCIHNNCWNSMVSVSDGNYHHLCVVSNETFTKLYVDGEKKAETYDYNITDLYLHFEEIWLGMDQDYVDSWGGSSADNLKQLFDGIMDEISIYRHALSDDEVAKLYNSLSRN